MISRNESDLDLPPTSKSSKKLLTSVSNESMRVMSASMAQQQAALYSSRGQKTPTLGAQLQAASGNENPIETMQTEKTHKYIETSQTSYMQTENVQLPRLQITLEDQNEDDGSEKSVPGEHSTPGRGSGLQMVSQKMNQASQIIPPSTPGDSFAYSNTTRGIDLKTLRSGLNQLESNNIDIKKIIDKRIVSSNSIKLRPNLQRKIKPIVDDPRCIPMPIVVKLIEYEGSFLKKFLCLSKEFRKRLLKQLRAEFKIVVERLKATYSPVL